MKYQRKRRKKLPDEKVKEVGVRIQHIRMVQGLRQRAVADMLGVSLSHYSKVEVGLNHPSFKFLHHFCDVFGVDFDWLVEGSGDPFLEIREPTAEYANKILGPRSQARMSERALSRVTDVMVEFFSETSVENVRKSAEELHIPAEKLLRIMIQDKLSEVFGVEQN